ncbi:hypothetical protein [Pandoraea sp. CB10b_02]|uniref:hypothetical protein n=1 Tax=Pandoraea sp. CB10b_02 TaxID=2014535 RepID=UPI00257C42F2|nr:hypothetical protein [Pandoraea sp. CB10b_02]
MSRRMGEAGRVGDGSAADSDPDGAPGSWTAHAHGVAGADGFEAKAEGAGGVDALAGPRSGTASILPCRPSLGNCNGVPALMRHNTRAADAADGGDAPGP